MLEVPVLEVPPPDITVGSVSVTFPVDVSVVLTELEIPVDVNFNVVVLLVLFS